MSTYMKYDASQYSLLQGTEDFSILKNRILRSRSNPTQTKLYYFDENLIYRDLIVDNNTPRPNFLTVETYNGKDIISSTTNPQQPQIIDGVKIQTKMFRQAVIQLKSGNKIDTLVEYYNSRLQADSFESWIYDHNFSNHTASTTDHLMIKNQTEKEIRRFITKINAPQFEREPENKNKNTFDFVRIYLSVLTSQPNKREFIKQNLKAINRLAVTSIENHKNWKKYGLETNYLRLTQCTLTQQSELVLLYELKPIGEKKNASNP